MHQIFISHANSDFKFIKEVLLPMLEELGLKSWCSKKDLRTGDWQEKISQALRECEAFLVVLSPAAVNSEWVKSEVHWWLEENGSEKFCPVLLEECIIDQLNLRMKRIQYVDFRIDPTNAQEQLQERLVELFKINFSTSIEEMDGSTLMEVNIGPMDVVGNVGSHDDSDFELTLESESDREMDLDSDSEFELSLAADDECSEPVQLEEIEIDIVSEQKWERDVRQINNEYAEVIKQWNIGRGPKKFVKTGDKESVIRWKRIADKGNAEGIFLLGLCYRYGKEVEVDEEQAIRLFRESAGKGNGLALAYLATYYREGQHVSKDPGLALELDKKAASQGNPISQANLGYYYHTGTLVKKDEAVAALWYRKAAEQGNLNAQYWLGKFYEEGIGVRQHLGTAINWYCQAAAQGSSAAVKRLLHAGRQGDVKAQLRLALCNWFGRGVKKNHDQAEYWLKRAAEQGDARALFYRGKWLEQEAVGPNDIIDAVESYILAAVQGNSKALEWCRIVGEKGDAAIQLAIGIICESKEINNLCAKTPVEWFKIAAERGNAEAQFLLGHHCRYGNRSIRNLGEAVKWYSLASEQGCLEAQLEISRCYRYGLGVPKNDKEAVMWNAKFRQQVQNGST